MLVKQRRNVAALLIFWLLSLNLVLFFIPTHVKAQAPTRSISRLTLPLASNANLIVENSNGTESHTALISDSLASTKIILSSDGTTVSALQYYPYGTSLASQTNRTNGTDTTNSSNRYYTGQRKITDTNLYNYNARYYNPDLGLFTQPDSIQGPNRFAYVGGNPVMKNDPTGHCAGPLCLQTGEGLFGEYIPLTESQKDLAAQGILYADTQLMQYTLGTHPVGAAIIGAYELASGTQWGSGIIGPAEKMNLVDNTLAAVGMLPGISIGRGVKTISSGRNLGMVSRSALQIGADLDTSFTGSFGKVNRITLGEKDYVVRLPQSWAGEFYNAEGISAQMVLDATMQGELGRLGVGPKVYSLVGDESNQPIGYIMDIADGDFPEQIVGRQNTTVRSAIDLLMKARKVEKAGYDIADFQYFVGRKGRISIIDPGRMRPLQELTYLRVNPKVSNIRYNAMEDARGLLKQAFHNLIQ